MTFMKAIVDVSWILTLLLFAETVTAEKQNQAGHRYVLPKVYLNGSLSNYDSVPANNNLKSKLSAKFLYICCIFSHQASISGCCSRELKRNSEVVYCYIFPKS